MPLIGVNPMVMGRQFAPATLIDAAIGLVVPQYQYEVTIPLVGIEAGDLVIVGADGCGGSGAPTASMDYGEAGFFANASRRNWGLYAGLTWDVVTEEEAAAGSVKVGTGQGSPYQETVIQPAFAIAYRGPTNCTVKTDEGSTADTGPTLDLTGFNKAALCRKIVALSWNRDLDATPGTPTGFTSRLSHTAATPRMGFRLADIDPSGYTDGADVTFTGMEGASDLGHHGYLLELT